MKIYNFKRIAVLLILIFLLGMIGCSKDSEQKETPKESTINLTKVLEFKGSYVGDNSAIGNIISNLPANIYSNGFELNTTSKLYEITIYYKGFEDIPIRFEDNSLISSSFPYVMKKNAMIILSLVQNVDIVNLNIDDGRAIIKYERTALTNAHKDDYGDNLEEITKDKVALENFIKTNQK